MATPEQIAPTHRRNVVIVTAGGQAVLAAAARHTSSRDRVLVLSAAALHAVPVTTEGAVTDPSEVRRSRDDLDEARAFFARRGVEADTLLVQGDAASAIVRAAEQHGADLVILGYERPGVLEQLLGRSVNDRVAHRAPCDVLIVHGQG
jgi:nucleotide-binding universal stress UspA family protein